MFVRVVADYLRQECPRAKTIMVNITIYDRSWYQLLFALEDREPGWRSDPAVAAAIWANLNAIQARNQAAVRANLNAIHARNQAYSSQIIASTSSRAPFSFKTFDEVVTFKTFD